MLFNSFEFILLFLPITLFVFFKLGGHGKTAIAWLVSASLFFYAWWDPAYLLIIIASICFNFGIGRLLSTGKGFLDENRKLLVIIGIACNLLLLGYYKYLDFFINNTNLLLDTDFQPPGLILPLAISFFTFQQIAYLVDVYSNKINHHSFLEYCLFVTFFPQLIAGPIVHHSEMLPQFKRQTFTFDGNYFAQGLTIFTLGLFKKVVIADNMAVYASPVFNAAADGISPSFAEAWSGALAYTFQLYFDFSGYSDMAIGLACMFGIILPLNFNSPYKANNIIDFWRRWHMTLSRFLKDYLYIPLGGSRKGDTRRSLNLMTTMLLGGLWHGAGWTFLFWGGLHGLYIAINHSWLKLSRGIPHAILQSFPARYLARTITFLAVIVSWVFFRAQDFNSALLILKSMLGMNVVSLPRSLENSWLDALLSNYDVVFKGAFNSNIYPDGTSPILVFSLLLVLYLIVNIAPNSNEIGGLVKDSQVRLQWQKTAAWAIYSGLLAAIAILSLNEVSEFLYFQF